MRKLQFSFAILVIVTATAITAQTPEPPPPSSAPPLLADPANGAYERRDTLPTLNVYLPEGQASVRLRKLIRNVLFESQINYKFVTGDISTFLRYKYYARTFTYRLGVFDEINFVDVGSRSSSTRSEFERVRGGLLLFGFPRDYNRRYFFLLQDDRLTFGNVNDIDNKKNNIYMKVGYQFGTQFDERLNAIVGESRGRITPVLTAFRDIGSQKTGLAASITESARVGTGDYKYTKLEAEGLRRTDLTTTSFIFSRLHIGTFFGYTKCALPKSATEVTAKAIACPVPAPGAPVRPIAEIDRFSIPRYEMFKLGGREALKAVRDSESRGTQEIHLTNEFFMPIFRNRDYRLWMLHWNTMYGIGYLGAGTVGFQYNQLTKTKDAVVDAGLGTEMAITVRDFDVLLSVIYARTVHAPPELTGSKVRFFIRTVR